MLIKAVLFINRFNYDILESNVLGEIRAVC